MAAAVKPILFNTEMVRAILDGRKTQTRRLVKPQPSVAYPGGGVEIRRHEDGYHKGEWHYYRESPPLDAFAGSPWGGGIIQPFHVGDVLWVRETWKQYTAGTAGAGLIDGYLYKADEPQDTTGMMVEDRWHPSIHMPKKAARLFLRVTDVRAERLHDMTAQDSLNEGVKLNLAGILKGADPLLPFANLWDSTINKKDFHKYCWAVNPWVWVIEFERCERWGWHADH